MNELGLTLLWLTVQVALLLVPALALQAGASGRGPAAGATVTPDDDGALAVTGMDAPGVGDLAAEHGIAVHALVPRQASLEDVYMSLTGESVEYRGAMPALNPETVAGGVSA